MQWLATPLINNHIFPFHIPIDKLHSFQVKEVKEACDATLVSALHAPTKEVVEGMLAATAQYSGEQF